MALSLEERAGCDRNSTMNSLHCLFSSMSGRHQSMPESEHARDSSPTRGVDILLIYNVVFLAFHQLFSSVVIMGLFIHFLLNFWLCVLNWDTISGLGFRD